MASPELLLDRRASLVEAVDHLLNRGVVLVGHSTISLAEVPLVYLGLNLVLTSVETLRESEGTEGEGETGQSSEGARQPRSKGAREALVTRSPSPPHSLAPSLPLSVSPSPPHSPSPPDRPDQGLAQLVLVLVELLRQVLERQAVRRAEGGGLSEEQVERMGVALMELEAKMAELRQSFDLTEEDVNLDLGPLGRML